MRPILLRELIYVRSRAWAGAASGVVAGLVFGLMMHFIAVPTPAGGRVSMIRTAAMVVRSDSIVVGWLGHLFNSAVLGAVFGWQQGGTPLSANRGLALGAFYGSVWWVLGAQILMPVLLGTPAFTAVTTPGMRLIAASNLIGHLVYGLILGRAFVWLTTFKVIHSFEDHRLDGEPSLED